MHCPECKSLDHSVNENPLFNKCKKCDIYYMIYLGYNHISVKEKCRIAPEYWMGPTVIKILKGEKLSQEEEDFLSRHADSGQ